MTGHLGEVPSKKIMRKLFPNIDAWGMTCANPVDYLIGVGKSSWQPTRYMKAKFGGDFWIWNNRFGSCVAGSHPYIKALSLIHI